MTETKIIGPLTVSVTEKILCDIPIFNIEIKCKTNFGYTYKFSNGFGWSCEFTKWQCFINGHINNAFSPTYKELCEFFMELDDCNRTHIGQAYEFIDDLTNKQYGPLGPKFAGKTF
jgi:hypothetical protein